MILLSERERKLLVALEKQATLKPAELAVQTGLSTQVVRYSLKQLRDAGQVSIPRPIINYYRLGYSDYSFVFNLDLEEERRREEFLYQIASHPSVSFLMEMMGQYRYALSVFAKEPTHAHAVMRELNEMLGIAFKDVIFSVRIGGVFFGRAFLAEGDDCDIEPLEFNNWQEPVAADETDLRVLAGLANERYRSINQLAEQMDIPVTTFERRKKQLEDKGVIAGYFLRINPHQIGVQRYKFLLRSSSKGGTAREAIYDFAKRHPNVVYLLECIGSWDYEVIFEVESLDAVTRLRSELNKACGALISELHEIPVLKIMKHERFPEQPVQ